MCREKRPRIGQTHRFKNSRKFTAIQKCSAKLRGNMRNMTKRMMQRCTMITKLMALKRDLKLTDKNAAAYDKSTADFC